MGVHVPAAATRCLATASAEALLAAKQYVQWDPNPLTRAAAEELVAAAEAKDDAAVEAVEAAFSDRLSFGTAGMSLRYGRVRARAAPLPAGARSQG